MYRSKAGKCPGTWPPAVECYGNSCTGQRPGSGAAARASALPRISRPDMPVRLPALHCIHALYLNPHLVVDAPIEHKVPGLCRSRVGGLQQQVGRAHGPHCLAAQQPVRAERRNAAGGPAWRGAAAHGSAALSGRAGRLYPACHTRRSQDAGTDSNGVCCAATCQAMALR